MGSKPRVLVMGTTGQVGSTVASLLSQNTALETVAAARNVSKVQQLGLMLMRQLADLTGTALEKLRGDEAVHHLREFYSGNLILNVDISPDHGEQLLQEKQGQLIAFGRQYISNPDLVARIRAGGPFNPQRPEGNYGATAEGYTDYPTLAEIAAKVNHV